MTRVTAQGLRSRMQHNDKPNDDVPEDVSDAKGFYCKFLKIVPDSKVMSIHYSHGSRIKSKLQCSYMIYPGFAISNQNDFEKIVSDLEKLKGKIEVSELILNFGCNDADRISKKFTFPSDLDFDEISKLVGNGREYSETEELDVTDPLGLFENMDKETYNKIAMKFRNYFKTKGNL